MKLTEEQIRLLQEKAYEVLYPTKRKNYFYMGEKRMKTKKIFKYEMEMNDIVEIDLPLHAEVLTIQTQFGNACLWALVDSEEKRKEKRVFRIAGTGHPIEHGEEYKYIDTIQLLEGNLVFHIFEILL